MTNSGIQPFDQLNFCLQKTPTGPISDTSEIESMLAACWDQFEGSDAEGMHADKLCGRMENVSWEPPELSFEIERHGQTVCGSSRASVHEYCLNIDKYTAHVANAGHRQLRPMNKRLDVKPIAEKVAKLIHDNQHDDCLKWSGNEKVTVLVGSVIPADQLPKQTLAGRRKRFRNTLDGLLASSGWKVVRANVYARVDHQD